MTVSNLNEPEQRPSYITKVSIYNQNCKTNTIGLFFKTVTETISKLSKSMNYAMNNFMKMYIQLTLLS